jgi:hypothetical protein
MKLMTKAIEAALPALYSTDGLPAAERKVVAKFFNPVGRWTWFVLEGEKTADGWEFFGLVDGHEREFGGFTLRELEAVKLPFGLGIERDISWNPTTTLAEVERRLDERGRA